MLDPLALAALPRAPVAEQLREVEDAFEDFIAEVEAAFSIARSMYPREANRAAQ